MYRFINDVIIGPIANLVGWRYLLIKEFPRGSMYHGDYWSYEDYIGTKAIDKVLIQLDPMPETGWYRTNSNIVAFFDAYR